MTNTIACIEKADVILITGSNTTENHPVLSSFMKRAVKFNGAKLIVVDRDQSLLGSTNLSNNSMANNNETNVLLRSVAAADTLWRYIEAVAERPEENATFVAPLEDEATQVLTDRAFVDAVKTGQRERVLATYEDGYEALRIARAADTSMRTGEPVTLAPGD